MNSTKIFWAMELDFCGRADYVGFDTAQDRGAFVAEKPCATHKSGSFRCNGRDVWSGEGFPTQGAGGQLWEHKGRWHAAVLCG